MIAEFPQLISQPLTGMELRRSHAKIVGQKWSGAGGGRRGEGHLPRSGTK